MSTRIAFDARYINDRYHGIGRYAFRLLEAMAAGVPEATFVVFRGKGAETRFNWESLAARPNVEFWDGPWPLYLPHEQLVWLWLLRRSRADVFHSPYFAAPIFSPCPVVITIHDLIFDRYPDYMPWGWSRSYYRLMMTLGTYRARRIVTVSRATASDLTCHYGTPSDKIAVIAEGVDPDFGVVTDQDQLAALHHRYGLARPFILAVGTRRPHKNLARLVHAFADMPWDHDLVFAGPPDPRFPDEARLAARHRGLNGRVHFLDWVPEADLPGLYTLAELVVVPSLVEGFGLPAMEAMACGAPVLAANTSSLPEVVGEAGALVDPYDVAALSNAMQKMLGDQALRRRLAALGRRRASTFTWPQAARQTWQVYAEALR